MLLNILRTLPEDRKDIALETACMVLSYISNTVSVPLMPPGSPLVALRTLLDAAGVTIAFCDTTKEAEELAAKARALGIQVVDSSLQDVTRAKAAAAELLAKVQKH